MQEKKIDSEELTKDETDVLYETIEDLKYQSNTNNEIIKLLESNMIKERLKNARN